MAVRAPLRAALAAVAALVACGGEGGGRWETVGLVAPDVAFDAPGAGKLAATLSASGHSAAVTLTPAAAGAPAAAFDVRSSDGGEALGRLLLPDAAAALFYHLASRDAGLPVELLEPNRLARVEGRDGARLGLLLDPAAAEGGAPVAIADLPVADAARLVALAQALGAWEAVARNRHPLGPDGRVRLPFFEPAPPSDWRALTQRSPAVFLPDSLGRWFDTAPGFRALHGRALAASARRLPALVAAAQEFADTAAVPGLAEGVADQAERSREAARALLGHLDSVWIELVVRAQPPGTARLLIDVYTVADVGLDALVLPVRRQLLLLDGADFAGLRLLPPGAGDAIPGRLRRNRVEFPLAREVAPRPAGPAQFAGTRLEYELSGLAALDVDLWRALAGLSLRATNRATGEEVAADHVSRLVSLDDPRFDVGDDPDLAAWLAGLDDTLVDDGGGPARLVPSADGRWLSLAPGRYRLHSDLVLPPGLGLVLEGGVDLRVAAGRSLLVRGPLEVRGTAARPVRVRAAEAGEPWGVLAVQGRGRSALPAGARPRSTVRYLELSGGSEDFLAGVRYTGQLSVHHEDLLLEHALLSDARGDDALNVKYGDAVIRASHFTDNAFDAVDLDFSAATVASSHFRGGGGDGLDVSGARVAVVDSLFGGFGDKCLSVGEASTLSLAGSLVRGCAIGLASKDSSEVAIEASVLLDNGTDLAAYQKKPMFGGGRIAVASGVSINAGGADTSDALSEVTATGLRRLAAGPLAGIDADGLRAASDFSRDRFRALGAGSP